jgi:hypothetical protein
MTQRQAGWVVFAAALGMMAGLMSVDVSNLHDWNEARSPSFVGTCLGHFGVVVAAFVGGKLLPTPKE